LYQFLTTQWRLCYNVFPRKCSWWCRQNSLFFALMPFLVVLVTKTNTRIVSFCYSERQYQLVLVKVHLFCQIVTHYVCCEAWERRILLIAGLLYQSMWCHTPGGCIFGVVRGWRMKYLEMVSLEGKSTVHCFFYLSMAGVLSLYHAYQNCSTCHCSNVIKYRNCILHCCHVKSLHVCI
jgi:hypothetical protein